MPRSWKAKAKRTVAWMRLWSKTSKPTEWISSISTALAILGGLISGVYLWGSGFLDAKKDAAEVRLARAQIETTKNEIISLRLDAKNLDAERKLEQANRALAESRTILDRSTKEKELLAHEISVYREQLAILERERTAVFEFRRIAQSQGVQKQGIPTIAIRYSDDNRASAIQLAMTKPQELLNSNMVVPKNQEDRFEDAPMILTDKARIFDLMKDIKTLTELRVEGAILDGGDIAVLHQIANLHTIEFINCSLDDKVLEGTSLPGGLWKLDLSHNNISRLPPGCRFDLNTLNLSYTAIDDDEVNNLAKRFPKLHMLLLDETKITPAVSKPISAMAELQTVSVSGYCINDENISVLTKTAEPDKVFKNIQMSDTTMTLARVLDLSRSSVTDAGLAKLNGIERFQWIDISGTKITDASLPRLSTLPKLNGMSAARSCLTEDGVHSFLDETSKRLGNHGSFFMSVDREFYAKYAKKNYPESPENVNVSRRAHLLPYPK